MLSSLPKLADKTFVLGFAMPVLLFLAAALALFSDLPAVSALLRQVVEEGGFEKLIHLLLMTWALAVLLLLTNHLQYQILEGYRWPLSKMRWLQRKELQRFDRLVARLNKLRDEWEAAIASHVDFPREKMRNSDKLEREFVVQFPADRALILPTRFGNAIRAFESYSRDIYGADSIPLWSHLATVMSKEVQGAVEDARARVDCLVNICFLMSIVAIASSFRFLNTIAWTYPINLLLTQPAPVVAALNWWFAVAAAGSALLARITYRLSIEQVYVWGGHVKAMFDCYLPELATKLGYQVPSSREEEVKFWLTVSRRAIYHRAFPSQEWRRAFSESARGIAANQAREFPEASEAAGGADATDAQDVETGPPGEMDAPREGHEAS